MAREKKRKRVKNITYMMLIEFLPPSLKVNSEKRRSGTDKRNIA